MNKRMEFVPIDYDYFDFEGRNFVKMIGRDCEGRRVCVVDSYEANFYLILRNGYDADAVVKKIEKVEVGKGGRASRALKTEVLDKHFLGKPVKAVRVWISNHKDGHDFASAIGDMEELDFRREYDIGLVTKYIKEKKVEPLQWYEVEVGEHEVLKMVEGLDVAGCYFAENITLLKNGKEFLPKVLAYDIETTGREIGEGEILMVSVFGEDVLKVISWKDVKGAQDYVEIVKDEAAMLERFGKIVREADADILCGYFSDGFDLPYLKARADFHKVVLDLGVDGRNPSFARGRISSGSISGVVHVDLFRFVDAVFSQYLQSETLSLGEVAKELAGVEKGEFEFSRLSNMNDKDWVDFFSYNLQDSVATYKLAMKLLPDMIEFCRIVKEPVFDVTRDRMATHVENHILHNLDRFDEIAERRPGHDESNERKMKRKFEGAFVFEPVPGFYKDIVMFDFTSMHASLIVTFNICGQALREKLEIRGQKSDAYWESPEFELDGKKVQIYFNKKPGFFSTLLSEIVNKRKIVKEEWKESKEKGIGEKEKGAADLNMLKARSNAYKLLANATFGYQGFFGARYYSREAAAATLAYVRKLTHDTMDKISGEGYKILYGDSVDGKTKIFTKRNGVVREEDIGELFSKIDKKSVDGKEYDFIKDVEVLTLDKKGNSVFKPIVYVMRHRCEKKMFRVHFTNNWSIDVTEDHSLMGYQACGFNQTNKCKENPLNRIIEVKPEEIGKKLNSIVSLKKIPYEKILSKNYSKEVYEFMGFFIGDGSFRRNKTQQKADKDYYLSLSLGKDGDEIFEKLVRPLIDLGYIKSFWWSKTRDGDITLNGLKLINIVSENCRDKLGKKIIPKWLFCESEENICSFLRGLFSADGGVMVRSGAPIIKYTSILNEYIVQVRKLLYRVGISHSVFAENSINKYKTEKKVYSSGSFSKNIILKDKETFVQNVGFLLDRKNKQAGIATKNNHKKNVRDFEFDLQGVKKVEEIKCPKYVYDIEVEEDHRFFANNVLVHNTDSIMFVRDGKSKSEILEFLKEINEGFPGIIELDLEGFFRRGLFVAKRDSKTGAKKKYALIGEDGKVKIRGFESVRRDWCRLSRNLQDSVLRKILVDGNEKAALKEVLEVVDKLKSRNVELEDLMIKTKMKRDVGDYVAEGPHVVAARRMAEAGVGVGVGTYVEYFVGEGSGKKVGDRVFLAGERVKYDVEYYLKKQILPAVEGIFDVFGADISAVFDGETQKKLF